MASNMNIAYKLFVEQAENAIGSFPQLHLAFEGDRPMLKGMLHIVDYEGKKWDDYEVEIKATEHFPNRFPDVFETSGKIPKIGDWHINEDTLTCCLTVPPEEIIKCRSGIHLTAFLTNEVLPYFFNQTHRRVEGYYVNGEYGHGIKGLLEYYSEKLNTIGNAEETATLLYLISKKDRPDRTSFCFCGSNKKYRHCHKTAYENLKQVGDDLLEIHAERIWKAYVD